MTAVKSFAILALLVGGTSLAIAQGGPPGPGVIPGAPAQTTPSSQSAAPATSSGARSAQQTKQKKKMFMSAKGHKGSKMTPASTAKPQMKQQ